MLFTDGYQTPPMWVINMVGIAHVAERRGSLRFFTILMDQIELLIGKVRKVHLALMRNVIAAAVFVDSGARVVRQRHKIVDASASVAPHDYVPATLGWS